MPRVVVVHPSHVVRSLLVAILSVHGFAPVEAETVEDAMAVIGSDPPDIAIVEEGLLAGVPSRLLPRIALTRPGRRSFAIAAGASCVVEKPVREEELMRAVRWVLEVYSTSAS